MTSLLTVKEVSKKLNVSQHTVRKWVLQRRISFVKIGGAVRFRTEDIEQLCNRGMARRAEILSYENEIPRVAC